MRIRLVPLTAVTLIATAAAGQQAVVQPLPKFTAIELVGGGEVTLRPGPTQRVAVSNTHPERTRLEVDERGTLRIRACEGNCRNQRLRIDIAVPVPLDAVAIRGGGTIRAEGGWPAQRQLSAASSQGGTLRLAAMPATQVNAAVQSGGTMEVAARDRLNAAVSMGGTINYRGDPRVTQAVSMGGAVRRIGN